MHLLIPFASAFSGHGLQTLRGLKLPNLAKLLARLTPGDKVGNNELSFTPPHERALAQLLGWTGADGCLPWAAHAAMQDDIQVGTHAWGLLTPVHWHVDPDHVSLPDPQLLHLSAQESHALFETVRPLFESEGWKMAWGGPLRWYVAHDSLEGLPCASLDRVIGRAIEGWFPTAPQVRPIRRLQNEVQMLLYQQPVNDTRVGLGALPVNSFWLSGCGRAQAAQPVAELAYATVLRGPALNADWPAWADAWRLLDQGALQQALQLAQQGRPITLTLCGERYAQRFETRRQSVWSGLGRRLSPPSPLPTLEAL